MPWTPKGAEGLCTVRPGQIITPFNIYFNPRYIYQKMELWRLVTNFLYFGTLGARACRPSPFQACPHVDLTGAGTSG